VRALSEGLRQKVKPYNIRTTVISPGAVATEFPDSVTDPAVIGRIQTLYKEVAIPADAAGISGRRPRAGRRATEVVLVLLGTTQQIFQAGIIAPFSSRTAMPIRFKALLFSFCALLCSAAMAIDITGAGSSAAAPLYTKWAATYQKQSGTTLKYQMIGSSAGIKQIKARAVGFGASDVALRSEELQKEKLICFPSAISGVVPVVNIPSVKSGELQLTGELLADIFARKILYWNDARIAAINPGVRLPKMAIVAVVRQDGSGTTYNFTDYLSKVSASWKAGFGTNFTIAWPADTTQVKGSSAVSNAVKHTAGAIGYIDYNYVVQDQLVYTKLRNHEGRAVAPSALSFGSALSHSAWQTSPYFDEMLTDKAGPSSWPITMGTFVIVPQVANDPASMIATLKFFTWAFMKGDGIVNGMDFVHLPDQVQARIYTELTKITDRNGKPLQWSFM
jgi:phosphate transport system substrate-binding protein